MVASPLRPRFAAPRLAEALEDSPVVLVHGPRQSGKSTLARTVGTPLGHAYLSFDDAALARPNPVRRSAWYRDFVDTIVQRDVKDLARIATLGALPRLLELAAGQTARTLNICHSSVRFRSRLQ